MERLKAVLLVGGLGTRLRPLTNDRPKSIVPVLTGRCWNTLSLTSNSTVSRTLLLP